MLRLCRKHFQWDPNRRTLSRFITSRHDLFEFLIEREKERRERRLLVTRRFCYILIYCSQDREEQGGGEGEARASATAGAAAAARSATRSAGIGRFRVGDSTCTCDGGRSSRCHRSQRLQHQWHPRHPGAPSGSQWQQHQEETQRWRWVIRDSSRSCRWPCSFVRIFSYPLRSVIV